MRRFIAFITLILIGIIVSSYFVFDARNRSEANYNFKVEGQSILVRKNDAFEEFIMNGVTLTATQPGVIPSGNQVKYETYKEWFLLMQEMGINTIKVDALMPGKFYKALKDYNIDKAEPIYLLQGIYFDEVALKDGYSPLDEKWASKFIKDIEATIDSVHGNANLLESIYLFKSDAIDVSDYLVGYVVGVNWATDDIAFSNLKYDYETFNGDYFYTDDQASTFEHFMAALLDYTAEYEGSNYRHQSLYSIHSHGGNMARFIGQNGFINDAYDAIRDYHVINAEHIKVNDAIKTGFFVNYDFEQVDLEVRDYASSSNDISYIKGFDLLMNYHTIPVVISAYGVPNGRFLAEYVRDQALPYIDEHQQADRTLYQYEYIRSKEVAGQFLRDWQDAWFKSSWYSADLKILDHSVLWRDVQTYGQGYGIVGFKTGMFKAHYLDDDISEWSKIKPFTRTERSEYKVTHDTDGLHLLIESDKRLTIYDQYIIGLDVTPHSGQKYFQPLNITFDNPIDFVLVLDGRGHYELFVHDYYDVNKFRLNRDLIKRYPNRYILDKDAGDFNPIYQYSDDDLLYYKFKEVDDDDLRLTGALIIGNNNPESEAYLSESDLFIGDKYMEIKIPFGLINFMSPASKMILDDFYDDHVFNLHKIDGLGLEFYESHAFSDYKTKSNHYTWQDWTNPAYEAYLKPVYYKLKTVMKGE